MLQKMYRYVHFQEYEYGHNYLSTALSTLLSGVLLFFMHANLIVYLLMNNKITLRKLVLSSLSFAELRLQFYRYLPAAFDCPGTNGPSKHYSAVSDRLFER